MYFPTFIFQTEIKISDKKSENVELFWADLEKMSPSNFKLVEGKR